MNIFDKCILKRILIVSVLPYWVKRYSKYLILVAFILLNTSELFSNKLSENAHISILTCAPGDELYSIFGHTAIRVADPSQNFDLVFNYGTFNFNTPNFYLKFARGQLDYMLSVTTFDRFVYEYRYEGRSVWEQVLDLNPYEKNQLFQALLINAEPENRFYAYHFFFDNCATRVRDIVTKHFSDGVVYDVPQYVGKMTFRHAIGSYLQEKPWIKLGLDLLLGQPTDNKVDASSVQFLPDYLMWQFDAAHTASSQQRLVKTTHTILHFDPENTSQTISPALWLWLGLIPVLVLSWIDFKHQKRQYWLDAILFSFTTLFGALIIFLWFFTSHSVTGPNWHILWANPLHLAFLFPLRKDTKWFIKTPAIISLGSIIGTLLFFPLMPQYIPSALIPVWLMLTIRSFLLLKRALI